MTPETQPSESILELAALLEDTSQTHCCLREIPEALLPGYLRVRTGLVARRAGGP